MNENTTTKPATETATKAAPVTLPATTEPQVKLPVSDSVISALDRATENGILAQAMTSQFKKMFCLGACMAELKNLLTPKVMEPIMALKNSAIGFMTDEKTRGYDYDVDVVRNAIIEAAVNGVSVCGNEFNIISGRFYLTKNGLKHKLRDIYGLSKNVTPGLPQISKDGSGAAVVMHIEWTYQGKTQAKDIPFAVRINKGMGVDGILGKATRKAYAWLYEEVTGNNVSEGDATDDVPITAKVTVESPLERDAEQPKHPEPGTNAEPTPAPAPAQSAAAFVDGELDM